MARRSHQDDSSLELLLDTITNTFGGVLFIALLIVLLVHLRGTMEQVSEPDVDVVVRMIKLDNQIRRARTEIDNLDKLLAKQTEQLTKQLDGVKVEEVKSLNDLKSRRDDLLLKRLEGYQEIVRDQKSINEKAKEFNAGVDLSGEITQAKRDLADLEDKIAKTTQESRKVVAAIETKSQVSVRELKLPSQKKTSKKAIYIAIWNNRAFPLVIDGALCTGHMRSASRNNAQVCLGTDYYQLNYSLGLTPRGTAQFSQKLLAMLGNPNSNRYYVDVFVFDGSFTGFQHVRDVIVHNGLQYDITPQRDDSTITFYRGGSSGGFAQ